MEQYYSSPLALKLVEMVDFPAVILVLILILGGWVLWKTQKDPHNNFDFTDMLRDEDGKPSAYRLAVFVCLAVSTWALMYMAIATQGNLDTWIFVWYIAIWSGAKVAEKAIDAYMHRGSRLPPPDRSADDFYRRSEHYHSPSELRNSQPPPVFDYHSPTTPLPDDPPPHRPYG